MNDPIDAARRGVRRVVAGGAVIAVVTAVWAFWPGRPTVWRRPEIQSVQPKDAATPEAAVDLRAYQVALWAPPPPPPVDPVKPQQIALKLQLIGIHREHTDHGDTLRATLYDPTTDRFRIVADGDTLGAFTVKSVTAKGVDLSDGTSVRTLALDSGGKAK